MRLSSAAKPILLSAILLTAASAGAQSKEQKAGARAAAEAGGDAFDAGKYAEAADLYERAERIMHAPPHLLYAARAHLKLGHLVEAREHYLTLTREQLPASAPRAFRDAQQLGEKELEDLEPRLPYVSVVVQGGAGASGVRVTRNGEAVPPELLGVPTPVNPGEYGYQAFAEGMESTATTVKLSEGVRETVVLTLRPIAGYVKPKTNGEAGPTDSTTPGGSLSTPMPGDRGPGSGGRPLLIGSLVGFGVAAAGGVVGTYFLFKSSSTFDKADLKFSQCDPTPTRCSQRQQDEVNDLDGDGTTQRGVAIAGYVAAGLGLATGITLLVMDSNRSQVAGTTLVPVVGLNYAGVAGRF